MKKVLIIGCPGSGKSTFARELHKCTDLPLHYLDMMFWNEDKTTVSRDEFDRRLDEVLKHSEWIIDGNYNRTLEIRFKACDTVFFLDLPTDVCISGIKGRIGQQRPDMPWVETSVDDEFLQFVNEFAVTSRPKILSLLEKYSDKNVVVFHSREEIGKYLSEYGK